MAIENTMCPKCKNTFQIKEKDGTIHICYDCLQAGKMDQHEKHVKDAKDFGIKV